MTFESDRANLGRAIDESLVTNSLMSPNEAAKFLRIRRSRLRRAMRRGQVPTVLRGKEVFVSRRALVQLLGSPHGGPREHSGRQRRAI